MWKDKGKHRENKNGQFCLTCVALHIYTMEYHSAMKRNEIGLFVVMWMNLESVIHSEVTQKEKTNIVH